jgi:hypothetical protein
MVESAETDKGIKNPARIAPGGKILFFADQRGQNHNGQKENK